MNTAHNQHPQAGRRYAVCLLALLLIPLLIGAMEPMLERGDHALTFTSTYDGTEQPYRLFLPGAGAAQPAENPRPLVVVLHGHGVDQNAWFDYTPVKEYAEKFGFIAAAPYGRGNYWYRGPGEQDVLDIIEEVCRLENVDRNRIALIGHSMGGWGTAWIGLRHSDLFCTIAPMSGWAPADLLPNALHLDPFLIHDGTDPIVPVLNTRTTAQHLAGLGVSHRYREEHGYGHASSMIGDNLENVFRWIELHPRAEHPRRLTLAARTPRAGSAWWLRLHETEVFPATALIEAAINDAGTITITTSNVARFLVHLDALPPIESDGRSFIVDGNALATDRVEGWVLFTKSETWSLDHVGGTPPAYESPAIELPWALPEASDIQAWGTAWVRVLMDECGGEVGFFGYSPFRDPGTPWTLDRLIDAYVYPEEQLARARVSGARLTEVITSNTVYFLVGAQVDTLDETRIYDVLAPHNLALRLTDDVEQLIPGRVDEILVKAAKKRAEQKSDE
ncbi:MAG: hypothetical protein PWP23_880 [Candidatus Sumerlaeota bacterium]|nr:hypothetical protein [Candidatus Sumerlaeota bacterium]